MYNKRDRDIVGGTGYDEAAETQIYNDHYYIRQRAFSSNSTSITVLNKDGEIVNEASFNDLSTNSLKSIMAFDNDSLFIVAGSEDIELQISNLDLDSLNRIILPLTVFEEQYGTIIRNIAISNGYIYGSGVFAYPYSGVDANFATNGILFKMNKYTLEVDTIIRYQYENAERTGFGKLTVEDNGDVLVTYAVDMEHNVGTVEPGSNINEHTGICRFDESLNLTWEYVIPNFGPDNTAYFHTKLANGNIVMSDVGTYSDEWGSGSPENEPALHCIDTEGNTLWRIEEYEFGTIKNLFSYTGMIATQDGGIIVSSDYIDSDPFFPATTIVTGGRLRKVSAEGDLLWDRLYLMTEELEEGGSDEREGAFEGVIEDENGDLFAYGKIDTDSLANSTDFGHWFVRTDSYGCILDSCEVTSIDLMEERFIDYFSIVNPVLNQIKVSLSEEVTPQKNELILYSITGEELERQKINSNSQLQIEVTNYSAGMYLLQLQENGKILQTEKVIIQ